MDSDAAFDAIMRDISAGNTDGLGDKVLAIADSSDDPFELVKCMSLLRVVNETDAMSRIARRAAESAGDDRGRRAETASALLGLGYPYEAYGILKPMDPDDRISRLVAMCLNDMEEYESAYSAMQKVSERTLEDRIAISDILSSMGEHSLSVANAEELLADAPDDYGARRCYVASLITAGRDKDAVRYARAGLKDKSVNGYAVAAYVMRVLGNVKSAGGFASRAVTMDPKHVGAMETLGICLALKGETEKARIVAGAINEASPGCREALNVLSYCGSRCRPSCRSSSSAC